LSDNEVEKLLEEEIRKFHNDCDNGFKSVNVKFRDFADDWFEKVAKLYMKSTTYERMKQLRGRIYNEIGHIRMDKIRLSHIQDFVYKLGTEGANERTGKPLAPKTIRHNVTFISDVFVYALKMGVVTSNPCVNITYPRNRKEEKPIYTPGEIDTLLFRLQGEPLKYKAFFTLIIYTGFRKSEMLGLEWKDVDFEHNVISVRRTSNYTKAEGIYTDTTKTRRSRRSIKVRDFVMDVLREYKAEQEAERDSLGDKWEDHDRLFVKWNGEPMNPQTPYGWLKEFCEKNDLPFYGLHSFRHFNASALINGGMDVTSVSSRLGHSVPSTTLNIYSHVFDEHNAKATDAIANTLDFSRNRL
jgi:integrase